LNRFNESIHALKLEAAMDYLQVGTTVDYVNKLRDLRKPGPRDEDAFYERHAPKEFRAWRFMSAFAVIGLFVVTGLIVT
jgi:hypothetical protein